MLSILFENVTNILFKNKSFICLPPFHYTVEYKPLKSRKNVLPASPHLARGLRARHIAFAVTKELVTFILSSKGSYQHSWR